MLKNLFMALGLSLLAPPLVAADEQAVLEVVEASDQTLSDYMWRARPLVVFADNPMDPRYIEQMELIGARADDLAERDVVVIVDTDPGAGSALRKELRPRGFMFVLVGKDGQKYLRKPFPWDVRELTRSIDKMPIRVQELDAARGLH